jgi:hypothetical protein
MYRHFLHAVVFFVGLAAVCWIGAGYVGSNPLGAAVALLIGLCYLAGGYELLRYRQATATLQRAIGALSSPPSSLGEWLGRLDPSLRGAVRLRVEGERAALPAPTLAPYLVGLLVLLGMLGTLLGMMATLRGTGLALESATDLQAMRGSLAAPVKGLGFAFGTSIAGVASSAMLGLLSALCRRERLQAAQALDAGIATTLRPFSQAHQREEAFELLRRQTELMPVLVERLQSMMAALEQQSASAHERQLAGQDAFHARTEATYARLAVSVEQSLKQGVTESAHAVSASIQPLAEATMAGLARETAAMREAVIDGVRTHLTDVSAGFAATTAGVADVWKDAVAEQRRAGEALSQDLQASLARFAGTFDQRSAGLVQSVAARLDASVDRAAATWTEASAGFATTTATVAEAWKDAVTEQRRAGEALAQDLRVSLEGFADTFDQRATRLIDDVAARLDATATQAATSWTDTLSRQDTVHAELVARNQQALTNATAAFETQATALVGVVHQSHEALQTALASHDRERLDTWAQTLGATTAALREHWAQAADHAADRQREICDTLAQTARDIAAQTQAHAGDTIAEISRLVQAASEAPKAAAEVIAELRQKLSDSMLRDTATLEERGRLLATVETLLNAVNHASTEQRTAIDALVATSADLLERVGTRFEAQVETGTGQLGAISAQVAAGAAEVASLGEAMETATRLFGQSNEALAERLQQIAGALENSLSRSDEQLAYYVAQAREVVDLSVLSQKQIIEEIQLLAERRANAGAEPA